MPEIKSHFRDGDFAYNYLKLSINDCKILYKELEYYCPSRENYVEIMQIIRLLEEVSNVKG